MKKIWIILFAVFALTALTACSQGQDNVFGLGQAQIGQAQIEQGQKNILIIVGEGGPSQSLFIKSALTYQKENGGEIREVHNGDEFISAIKDFAARNEKDGKIDHLEYFGHGNNVGLYVNQTPNVNGGLYVNDPDLNKDYSAASIYEVDKNIFSKYGWIKFNGCNVAEGHPSKDTFAQRIANYFNVDVVAPIGPTEFSKKPNVVDQIEGANSLSPDFEGDVYMVATYSDKGFIAIHPQEISEESGYTDVRNGQSFEEAVIELRKRGLNLEDGLAVTGNDSAVLEATEREFLPYKSVNYKEAVQFCEIAFGMNADCEIRGYEDNDKIRNLHALKMLTDTSGAKLKWTNPWYNSYIWRANQNSLLTDDFVHKKWYTRGEMAELTWNFIRKSQ